MHTETGSSAAGSRPGVGALGKACAMRHLLFPPRTFPALRLKQKCALQKTANTSATHAWSRKHPWDLKPMAAQSQRSACGEQHAREARFAAGGGRRRDGGAPVATRLRDAFCQSLWAMRKVERRWEIRDKKTQSKGPRKATRGRDATAGAQRTCTADGRRHKAKRSRQKSRAERAGRSRKKG